MEHINKQKFLAELGKLLTFMYEEDRQRALGMYSRMFDEAGDEVALLQSLSSPTKQAVIVARAYNSNVAKLSVYSESKLAPEDADENGVPDYVQAIDGVRAEAFAHQPAKEADEETEPEMEDKDQINLFDEAEPETEPEAETEAEPEQTEEPEAEPEVEPESEPETQPEPEAEPEQTEEPEAETRPEPEAEPEAQPAPEQPAEPEKEPEAETKSVAAPAAAKGEGIEYFTLPAEGTGPSDATLDDSVYNIDTEPLRKTVRKAKPLALIIYIIFAIPVTLAGIALLLIPALVFLALSVAAIVWGVVIVSMAFKTYTMFADLMVVLGAALILFALGLLFLWTSIWFVGGAIVGLVHGVAALCDKWCYKEVQI